MKQSKKFLLGFAVLLVWCGSLALTYQQTREKWFDLGTINGEINGRAIALSGLCQHAINGAADGPIVWSLDVKASLVELSGKNGFFTLHCR
ncbi:MULTISPECIES: hypothetical protein [Falsihalocynthiibacter]|uniref:hypothetical protein n=1 Tax=Falsihalocynthiibacter TaxID=2854182 RepID=UPI00300111F1